MCVALRITCGACVERGYGEEFQLAQRTTMTAFTLSCFQVDAISPIGCNSPLKRVGIGLALYRARTMQERNEGLTAWRRNGVVGWGECSAPRTDIPPHSHPVVVWA